MKTKYINAFFCMAALALCACSSQQDWTALSGQWQGEFMPGNDFTLTLLFETDSNNKITGRVQLVQGSQQIQDDPLSKIKLHDSEFSFYIADKKTPFKGILDVKKGTIDGEFLFPDGAKHPLHVQKIAEPAQQNIQNAIDRTFASEWVEQDFLYLVELLQTYHPQLYLYQSKKQFDALCGSIEHDIRPDMHEDEIVRLFAPLVASIGCSHTILHHSEALTNQVSATQTYFPLKLKCTDTTVRIIQNYSTVSELQPGAEILAINGQPIKELYTTLENCIPADAFNKSFRRWMLDNRFAEMYALFIGNRENYTIDYRFHNKILTAQVPAVLPAALHTLQKHSDLPYSSRNINADAALLNINSFMAPDFEAYARFLHDFFESLAASTLLIDVRDNMGGHPIFAAELLSWLMPSEFVYFQEPQELEEFKPLLQPMQPKAEVFSGSVYVLMNGGCLSTTGHFLSLLKYHNRAALVGETAGASFYCNDNRRYEKLPNTGIRVNIPQTTFVTAVQNFQKGELLRPDNPVHPTVNDLLAEKDVVLEHVLKLIK